MTIAANDVSAGAAGAGVPAQSLSFALITRKRAAPAPLQFPNSLPPPVSFAPASANLFVPEAPATLQLTVQLQYATLAPYSVGYNLGAGTATLGQDFNFAPGSLSFAAGEKRKVGRGPSTRPQQPCDRGRAGRLAQRVGAVLRGTSGSKLPPAGRLR